MTECTVWWAAPLTDRRLHALLDAHERRRYADYRQEADRSRFLTGRAIAKYVVGELLGIAPGGVRFDASCADCDEQHGPPRVPGTPVALSISHSGDRIGVAVTAGPAVGLDVEAPRADVDDALIGYALNAGERATLRALPAGRRAAGFVGYWTRKEAVLKATGRGLRIPLRSITLAPPDEPAGLLASTYAGLRPDRMRIADLDPGDGYRAAVAVSTSQELDVTEKWWAP
ncbi:4'-phosphopantetheinyl transferase family protein [Streptomyces sp. NPDC054841]